MVIRLPLRSCWWAYVNRLLQLFVVALVHSHVLCVEVTYKRKYGHCKGLKAARPVHFRVNLNISPG